MIDIELKLNGRTVRPKDIGNEIEKAMIKQVQEHVSSKLQCVRDPETGMLPKITIKGSSLNDLSFEVSGSEAVINEVKRCLS